MLGMFDMSTVLAFLVGTLFGYLLLPMVTGKMKR